MLNNVPFIRSRHCCLSSQWHKLLAALFFSLYFLPAYAIQTSPQNQRIAVTGSATSSNLISLWAEDYANHYPNAQSIQTGRYPLARKLFVIINNPPGYKIALNIKSFLDYARSPAGQVIASEASYVTLPKH